MTMHAEKLNLPDIAEAQRLLYDVLVREQDWQIPENNPSQLKTENGRLCDMYDAHAHWFGVYDDNKLIGCHRCCAKVSDKFEFERYNDLPTFISEDERAIEGTRLAIAKKYRRTRALITLLHYEFNELQSTGYKTLFTTGFYPVPGQMYIEKFGFSMHDTPFRYYKDDPEEVYLLYAECQGLYDRIDKRLARLSSNSRSGHPQARG